MLSLKIDLDLDDYFSFLESLKEKLTLETSREVEIYLMALHKEIPLTWKKYLDTFKNEKILHVDDFVESLKRE